MEAFVYIWNDKLNSRMYLGSHKGTPDDGYICSSNPMLEQYTKRPNDFSRVVVAEGSWVNMRRIETNMLQKVDAARNPMYYNKSNGDGKFYNDGSHNIGRKRPDLAEWNRINRKGIIESINTRNKKSVSHQGKKLHNSTIEKLRQINLGSNNPMFGKHLNEKTIQKLSYALSGSKNPMFGKKHRPESIEKMRLCKLGNKNAQRNLNG